MRRVLYLGTKLPSSTQDVEFVHYPLIEVILKPLENLRECFVHFTKSTHLIFTSRHAVAFTMEALRYFFGDTRSLKDKVALVIGPATEQALSSYEVQALYRADPSTQEGVISLLDQINLKDAYLFYPRSSRARAKLANTLQEKNLDHHICDLYDTSSVIVSELPSLEAFDEILFTSPSSVEAFFSQIKMLPKHIKLTAIGPVTKEAIEFLFSTQLSQVK